MKLANWTHLKVRSDLQVSPQSQEGSIVYVVKDPLTLRYFRLRPAEYAIFRMLDGETPTADVQARLKTLGHDIPEEELKLFIQQLGTANFFENVLPNQSESLYRMALMRRSRRSLWQQVKRILYIKLPLYDPDKLFTLVMPYIRWLWSPWAAAAYVALILAATYVFIAHYEEAARDFAGLLSPEGLFVIAGVLLAIKVFHEISHGLTCKRFGGEVHELGVLVLVLFPCLYCNISDAWVMEKRSRKMWTSAAGIISELLIAAMAALVWHFTAPGTLNSMAYQVMIVTVVYSVVFNANPLMKWDGYYILSDILGMPNLRANSLRYLGQFFRKYILGMEVAGAGAIDRSRVIQLAYGVLSTTWIIMIMYSITKGMLARFPALGVWVLISTLYGAIFIPLVRLARYFAKRRGDAKEMDLGRLSTVSAVIAVLAYFTFIYDMGYSVTAPCVIEPARRQTLKAAAPGVLVEMPYRQGDAVREGEVVARLDNPTLGLALKETRIEIEKCRIEMDQARGAKQLLRLDVLGEKEKALEAEAAVIVERMASLTIRAPFSGTVLSPMPASQVGRWLLEGGDICVIGNLDKARVTIAVGEPDLRFIKEAAEGSVVLRAYPWRSFKGTVDLIANSQMQYLSNAALSSAAGGGVVTRPDIREAQVPLDRRYQVSIVLPNDKGELLMGMAGKATISSGTRRLYDRVYVAARENLRRSFGI